MATVNTTESASTNASLESRVYSQYRILAALQLSMGVVRTNQEIVKNPPTNQKLKDSDKIIDPFVAPLAPYICYISAPASFVYGLFALKYSPEEHGHVLE